MKNKYSIPKYRIKLVREKNVGYGDEEIGYKEAAARILHKLSDDLDREAVFVLYVDGRNMLIGVEQVALGGKHGCAMTPQDILRGALLSGCSAFIMGHNHPSGDPRPSTEDIQMTRAVISGGEVIGLPLLDHIIVCGNGKSASLFEMGVL